MRCDNCHSDTEIGLKADFMSYSFSPETIQQKGRITVFRRRQLSYTPFSIWFCRDCIIQNRRRIRWLIPAAFLGDILTVILFWNASVRRLQLQLPVALLLLLLISVTFYLIYLIYKPYHAIVEADLSVLFFLEIKEIRAKRTGQPFHMTLRQYQKRHQNQ